MYSNVSQDNIIKDFESHKNFNNKNYNYIAYTLTNKVDNTYSCTNILLSYDVNFDCALLDYMESNNMFGHLINIVCSNLDIAVTLFKLNRNIIYNTNLSLINSLFFMSANNYFVTKPDFGEVCSEPKKEHSFTPNFNHYLINNGIIIIDLVDIMLTQVEPLLLHKIDKYYAQKNIKNLTQRFKDAKWFYDSLIKYKEKPYEDICSSAEKYLEDMQKKINELMIEEIIT